MLLMIDNYDSFTYNLVQYFAELGEDVRTFRNDEITLEEIAALKPDRICISPGPCTPHEAGISIPVIERFAGQIPILGVFKDLPSPYTVIRYHSLAIERASLPDCLEVTAWTDDGEIMGVRHKEFDLQGVQFHPESILSEHGHALLKNFLTGTARS